MPVLILLQTVALALSLGPTARPALLPRRCPAPIAQAVSTSLSTVDAAKIFGRLAEKTLYLDATVGACCHSACSDCEWRTPGGGYRWDVMKAQVAKWLPCYLTRDFADERALAFGYKILPECACSIMLTTSRARPVWISERRRLTHTRLGLSALPRRRRHCEPR